MSLEQRVAALEQALQLAIPPDQIAPNYLTQDAQGNVGADFSGAIHASSGDFTGSVFATDVHVPSATAEPRIDIDSAGLRATLANGTEGARIVANTPRPLFIPSIGDAMSPIPAGVINITTGSGWNIDSGGDHIFGFHVGPVPPGVAVQGLAGAMFFNALASGASRDIFMQAERVDGVTKAGGALGLRLPTPSQFGVLVVPWSVDNTAGGSTIDGPDDDIVFIRAASNTGTAQGFYDHTGFVIASYG